VPPWIGGKCARRRCWAPLETCTLLYWSTTRTLPCSSYCRSTDQLPQSRPDKLPSPMNRSPREIVIIEILFISPAKDWATLSICPSFSNTARFNTTARVPPQKEMTFRGSPYTRLSWRVQVLLPSSEKSRQSSLPSQTAELGINSWDWRQWKLLEQWSSSLASPQSSTRLQTASYFTQFLLRHGK
jgi:hypothetical protein